MATNLDNELQDALKATEADLPAVAKPAAPPPAPRKKGKSIAMLVHWTRMALEGATVIILDRENGADEYARRLRVALSRHYRPTRAPDARR